MSRTTARAIFQATFEPVDRKPNGLGLLAQILEFLAELSWLDKFLHSEAHPNRDATGGNIYEQRLTCGRPE